jgi:hypothetical protein
VSARLVLVLLGVSGAAVAADPVADISRCAAVADRDARLACYDDLGSRYAAKKAAPAAAIPAQVAKAAAAPAPSAATATAAAALPTAAVPPRPPAQSQSAPPVARTSAPPESREQFGLQPNQLPKDPEAPKKLTAIEGVVSGFGHAPNGHQVVRVDNTQSWEMLQDSDPLLVPGDKVSIRRALLGSFIMTTPSGREHRVKRLTQ